jgi:D-alanyl-D-alanine carboxypeptidase
MKNRTLAYQCFQKIVIAALVAALVPILAGIGAPAAYANSKFATIAIDARSGKVLYARNADAPRYPASLTKVMTLYLLFEDLRRGKLTHKSLLKVSKTASHQAPSKLGLKPGSSIHVDDAIRALVTKSANDVAVVVAENLAGGVPQFAERMTAKARELGMTRTRFRNPSGLPDVRQTTTARDMATLALRVQRDFPEYYKYFSLKTFKYGNRRYRNHNRLLGRVKGVDGIKTGYTRASGFNLTTSARRNHKRVVAVVLGGKTGRSRNAFMHRLIERMFRTKKLTRGKHLAVVAGTPPGYTNPTRLATVPPRPRSKPMTETANIADISQQAALQSLAEDAPAAATDKAAVVSKAKGATFVAVKVTGETVPAGTEATPEAKNLAELVSETAEETEQPSSAKPDKKTVSLPSTGTAIAALAEMGTTTPQDEAVADVKGTSLKEHLSSWNIQIGAFPTPQGAAGRLESAQKHAKRSLIGKKPFTMETSKNGETLYRARFSGFDQRSAVRACKVLSRKGVSCFTLAPRS